MSLENTGLIDLSQARGFQVNVSQFYTTKIFLKLFNFNGEIDSQIPSLLSAH